MNKTRLPLACAKYSLLPLALILSACGGSDDSEGGSDPDVGTVAAPPSSDLSGTTATVAAPPSGDLSGTIAVDGSSTVAPLMTLAAEDFENATKTVTVTVGTSGTGGGMEKFCAGEIDIANASRKIKDEEIAVCEAAGVTFTEVVVANDAISVVVNPSNDWAACLTVDQLKAIWEPAAEGSVNNWNQVDAAFPDQSLTLYGAGTDSGTFDYFTAEINGEEGASRTDYNPTEDDNITVTGVSSENGALGYFGFSYLEENIDAVKPVAVDAGDGCVEPSAATVADGSYQPLARELYVYVANSAAARPEVKAFVEFYAANQAPLQEEALFIGLNDEQLALQAEEIAKLSAA